MPEGRFPKQLFSETWPHKGRQRKTWDSVIGEICVALGIDKGECLKEFEKGDSSAALFMASVDERICER